MTKSTNQESESAIGAETVTVKHGPDIVFRSYLVERPGHTKRLRAVEGVFEMSITVPHPVKKVWPIFKNFNSWMGRFGYVWDRVPADSEDKFVYLIHAKDTGAADDWKYGSDGARMAYVVRKVIPERLIYWDSLPLALADKDGVWSGHNVASLQEENGRTTIVLFFEHTWYSETMTIEELRSEAKGVMFEGAPAFWRDYNIPDLISQIEAGTGDGDPATK